MAIHPNISEMLGIAHCRGLTSVDDAWIEYARQYDLFLDMKRFDENSRKIWDELRNLGLLGMTINDAARKIGLDLEC